MFDHTEVSEMQLVDTVHLKMATDTEHNSEVYAFRLKVQWYMLVQIPNITFKSKNVCIHRRRSVLGIISCTIWLQKLKIVCKKHDFYTGYGC